ncbi:hypothetical protein PUV54_05035 [Hyphococcus flavus]|uniref:Uncharacterized protein n=1 Tax=Hyphococcus flavus TaxID=1866326 RepID=A0AAE9ZCS9_9PROT|nr:hypothetical protein [Hyphococcus flavus]WDI32558.1 hypothetical protein PUV54_05035 [Hyphococcus flavus]
MPHETQWADHGIEWRYFGHVTADEARSADQAFYSDPRSDYARYQLIDLRDVTQLDFPESDQELSAAIDGAASYSVPWVRIGFIVPDDRFDKALELYIALISKTSWSAKTFTDPEAARRWCENDDESAMLKLRRRLALDA